MAIYNMCLFLGDIFSLQERGFRNDSSLFILYVYQWDKGAGK